MAYVPLSALWLPIIVSAVIVFVASSILHMLLSYHNGDYRKLPDEDAITAPIRAANLTPGNYHFPYCTHKEMNSPAAVERFNRGPVGFLTMYPNGRPNMGKFLGLWFAFCLIVGLFVAYLSGRTLAPGTDYLQVFRVAGTTAFLAYGLGQFPNAIWRGFSWSLVLKEMLDGLIYAGLVGGTFGWRWPH